MEILRKGTNAFYCTPYVDYESNVFILEARRIWLAEWTMKFNLHFSRDQFTLRCCQFPNFSIGIGICAQINSISWCSLCAKICLSSWRKSTRYNVVWISEFRFRAFKNGQEQMRIYIRSHELSWKRFISGQHSLHWICDFAAKSPTIITIAQQANHYQKDDIMWRVHYYFNECKPRNNYNQSERATVATVKLRQNGWHGISIRVRWRRGSYERRSSLSLYRATLVFDCVSNVFGPVTSRTKHATHFAIIMDLNNFESWKP